MSEFQNISKISRRSFIVGGVACSLAAIYQLVLPHIANADELGERIDEYQEVAAQIKELQIELEKAADKYYKTQIIYKAAQKEADSARSKIFANAVLLKSLQDRLSERIGSMYRNGETNMLDVLMGSASFEDFAVKWDLIGRMNDGDAALAAQIREVRASNEQEHARLSKNRKKAEQRMKEAEKIQREAEEKIAELNKIYEEVSGQLEGLLGLDQIASLMGAEDVMIIGNPRNIEPHPEVVDIARSRIGCPYVWAAAGPNEFDCSGLVVWVFDKAGIQGLPHYTESLYKLALYVGAVVPLEDVEPGDVLYRPGHVGIAAGKGGRPYIHAPNAGAFVRDTDSLAYSRFSCGLRFPGAGSLSAEELAGVLAQIEAELIAEDEEENSEQQREKEERERRDAEIRKQEDEDRKRVEELNKKAQEEAQAEAKAREQAEEEARAQAEAQAQAEEEARRAAEEARAQAEAQAQAEEEARRAAEEAQAQAEEEARRAAEDAQRAAEASASSVDVSSSMLKD